ncbi:hypothetical protein PROFUN_15505 [Planoprotostelium fungivorum]|uniref:Uncharacterized protein n=1 Tax=Planoprotostelium fungivorum TaxID=1890364 RepID=A0A2P6MSS7_9EUKA|nr:hypothetical protein PROFUN_15505 [Planoprotostelium fungivorum]
MAVVCDHTPGFVADYIALKNSIDTAVQTASAVSPQTHGALRASQALARIAAAERDLPTTMGSICDHKYIVYGSSDSSAERYRLSTPSIRAK